MTKKRIQLKPYSRSIIVKLLLAFLLFGSLLMIITVSIQYDFAETTTEELTAAQEMRCLSALETNLGSGDWAVREHCLYKGNVPLGDGTNEKANIEPFLITENETGFFVYSFIASSLADEAVLAQCTAGSGEATDFLRVAGSTLDADGKPIVGTFLERSITEELEKNDVFTGRSTVGGRSFYCCYNGIRDKEGRQIGVIVAGRSIEEFDQSILHSALNSSLAVGVLIIYTFFALFLFIVKWNRSLKRMENYLIRIGSGAYPDTPLKISGGDELSSMADVINDMNASLIEKKRLGDELALARAIQAGMLPNEKAAQELPKECRVHGFMLPAREVGGDLYDFFMIDKSHLGLVIADVSDKGAPAALFMATSQMCIKDSMLLGMEPKEVLRRVNNRLLENNPYGLFVTAWVGMIDLKDGHMQYAMAGHPYPFIRRSGSGGYEQLMSDKNLVLAGLPDFDYLQAETTLQPGDRIFLYTDGLDEARDASGGFFGKQRIREYLDTHGRADIRETVTGMKEEVSVFAKGCEQFDDLTMLMVEYTGGDQDE